MTSSSSNGGVGEEVAGGASVRRQRSRSLAIAWALGILVLLFYAATIVRLGPKATSRDDFSRQALPESAAPAVPGSQGSAPPVSDADCKKAGTC